MIMYWFLVWFYVYICVDNVKRCVLSGLVGARTDVAQPDLSDDFIIIIIFTRINELLINPSKNDDNNKVINH